jgi:hypothetical protein
VPEENFGRYVKINLICIKLILELSPRIIRIVKSRRTEWAGHVARMREKRNVYTILAGKPGGKRPIGRPRRRWVDNIKMDPREIGFDGFDCSGSG